MQSYDVLMLAVLGGSILFGLWKGFAWQVASLSSIVVSYVVARNFSGLLAERLGGDPAWNRFLAMFILFFGCSFVIWMLFRFVRNTIEQMHLKTFDRQVGAALGAVKGIALCIIVTLFSVSLLGEGVCRNVCTSISGNYVAKALANLHGVVPDEIRQYVGPYVDRFNSEMQEHQAEAEHPATALLPFRIGTQPPTPNWTDQQSGGWVPPVEVNPGNGNQVRFGNLEPAGAPAIDVPTWTGQLQHIDWSRAGETLDNYLENQRQR